MPEDTENICVWEADDLYASTWLSDCDLMFEFDDGGPEENGFVYCPRCGEKIVIETKQ